MPVKDYQILNYQIKQLLDFSYSRNLLNNWLKFEVNKREWQFYPSFFEQQFQSELTSRKNSEVNQNLTEKNIKVRFRVRCARSAPCW